MKENIKCPICGGKLVEEVYNENPTKDELTKSENKEIFLNECNQEDIPEEEGLMSYHCYNCSTSFSKDLKQKEKVYYSDITMD